jgi:hypothetical protein
MTITEKIEKTVPGFWRYNRATQRWDRLDSEQLPSGMRTRQYVVRESRGLVLYDSAQPHIRGRVILGGSDA